MTREAVFQRIAKQLLECDILNEQNYNSNEDLLQDVICILADNLKDYLIVFGHAVD